MDHPALPFALDWLDYFGIAVFAVSGALLAAEKKQTLVTFLFFAVVTGVGGGTLRDLLIGAPVFWVHNNATLLICIGAALLVWLVGQRWFAGNALLWFDAVGPRRLCDVRRGQGAELRSRAGPGLRHGRAHRLRRRHHPRRARRRPVDPDAARALRHRRRAVGGPVRAAGPRPGSRYGPPRSSPRSPASRFAASPSPAAGALPAFRGLKPRWPMRDAPLCSSLLRSRPARQSRASRRTTSPVGRRLRPQRRARLSFADGLADPQVRPRRHRRRSGAGRLDQQVRRRHRGDEAGRAPRSSISIATSRATSAGRLRNPAFPDRPITLRNCCRTPASLRDHDDQYVDPARQLAPGSAWPTRQSWDLAHGPGDGYFTYGNMNFPVIGSIVEQVTGERFDIWMRREVLDADEDRRLLQLADVQRCRGRPSVVSSTPDGETRPRRSRRQRPDCPVYVAEGEACDLARSKLGENGAPVRAARRPAHFRARPCPGSAACSSIIGTLDGVRILSAASVDALLAAAVALQRRATETPTRACIAATASPPSSIAQPRSRLQGRSRRRRRGRASAMPATPTASRSGCGSTAGERHRDRLFRHRTSPSSRRAPEVAEFTPEEKRRLQAHPGADCRLADARALAALQHAPP